MGRTAIFPGSFDPFTLGHKDIVERALAIFDKVIIAIGVNSEKRSSNSLEEKIMDIKRCFPDGYASIEVDSYEGLTVDYCRKRGVFVLIRGVRDSVDWEYERKIDDVNKMMEPKIETVFFQASPEYASVSSSVVREIMKFGGDVSKFLP